MNLDFAISTLENYQHNPQTKAMLLRHPVEMKRCLRYVNRLRRRLYWAQRYPALMQGNLALVADNMRYCIQKHYDASLVATEGADLNFILDTVVQSLRPKKDQSLAEGSIGMNEYPLENLIRSYL